MPKIQVEHQSSSAAPDAISKIKNFFETDATIKQVDADIKCTFDTDKLTGKVTGSKFKADVSVKPQGAGSSVSVIIDLPLLLSPFKGKVEEILKHKLQKYLS